MIYYEEHIYLIRYDIEKDISNVYLIVRLVKMGLFLDEKSNQNIV